MQDTFKKTFKFDSRADLADSKARGGLTPHDSVCRSRFDFASLMEVLI